MPYFWAKILKNYCLIWNQHPRICLIVKFCEETKIPKFGTKNALLEYFWPKMPYLGIFGQELKKKNYCHIWNQHPQICLFAKFHEKTKMPKFGTKKVWFMYFWAGIWKQYCHISNQHPRICLIGKFREKAKMPKFKTKNASFGCFWPEIPYLGIFGLEF